MSYSGKVREAINENELEGREFTSQPKKRYIKTYKCNSILSISFVDEEGANFTAG